MVTKLHEATEEVPAVAGSSNGLIASLDDILAIDDIRYETVYVPEWDRSVRLVSLTGLSRNRIAISVREHAKKLKGGEDEAQAYFQARVIAESLVDADGNHIADQSHAAALMAKNGGALTRLFMVAARLSGMGLDQEQEAIDDLKGTPSVGTGSD